MISDNPFVQRIGPDDGPFNNYEEISGDDINKYALQGVHYKFLEPDKMTYLNYKINFIGFDINDSNEVKVFSIFLDEYKNTLQDLEKEFGPSDLSFELAAEAELNDASAEKLNYTSYTWVKKPYTLTFSLYPMRSADNKELSVKSRILIKER